VRESWKRSRPGPTDSESRPEWNTILSTSTHNPSLWCRRVSGVVRERFQQVSWTLGWPVFARVVVSFFLLAHGGGVAAAPVHNGRAPRARSSTQLAGSGLDKRRDGATATAASAAAPAGGARCTMPSRGRTRSRISHVCSRCHAREHARASSLHTSHFLETSAPTPTRRGAANFGQKSPNEEQ
jgi:cytochrome c553